MRLSHTIAAGALLLAAGFYSSPLTAQQAEAPAGPGVGDMAPDFTITGVTRHGTLRDPIRLSDYRGQTVVLAAPFRWSPTATAIRSCSTAGAA